MPAPVLKMFAKAPDGTKKSTSVSLTKYTMEQAQEIGRQWKLDIKAGRVPVRPIFPRDNPKPSEERKPFQHMDLFDTLELPTNGGVSFGLLGSTRSGKSTALCAIYERYFKHHITTLFTLSSQADIYKPLKKAIIVQGYYDKMVTQPMKLNNETSNKYNFCLVFDDLSTDGKNAPGMTRLLTTGRNSGCSAIISGQKMSMLSATGRSNVNYVLCFKQNSEVAIEDTIKCFLRSYFPKNMSIPDMISLYKELTQDYCFFVIDTLNDKCFLSKINVD